MIDIWKFFCDNFWAIIVCIILLIIALIFLPDSISIKVFCFIKPKPLKILKNKFKSLIRLVVYNEHNETESMNIPRYNKIQDLNKTLKEFEQAYFLVDSIMSTFNVLNFSLQYGLYDADVYENVALYFRAYCEALFKLSNKNISRDIGEKFDAFGDEIEDIHSQFNKLPKGSPLIKKLESEQKESINKFIDFLVKLKGDIEKNIDVYKKNILENTNSIIEEMKL